MLTLVSCERLTWHSQTYSQGRSSLVHSFPRGSCSLPTGRTASGCKWIRRTTSQSCLPRLSPRTPGEPVPCLFWEEFQARQNPLVIENNAISNKRNVPTRQITNLETRKCCLFVITTRIAVCVTKTQFEEQSCGSSVLQ